MKEYKLKDELTPELFRNPTAEYRGTPFWSWNGKLEKEELLWQIGILKEMGFGGFHMHSRTGMNIAYLSEEFMELVKLCVTKAREEKLLAWLYDEDRYPSGAAGGLVTKEKQYRARHLLFTPERKSMPEIAAFAIRLDEGGYLESYDRLPSGNYEEKENETVWYAYLVLQEESPWFNNQTYVNTLDKKSIDRFIEVTYDAYKAAVGEAFEDVIPSIFTDEPQFSHKTLLKFAGDKTEVILPWTDDLPETFWNTYQADLLERLPVLVWEQRERTDLPIRYHYHDHVAERFTQAFADNCGAWCEKNNLLLTGHMMEEPTLRSQTAALGEAMRSYRSFGIPGIDMLCNNYEYTTAKQAQSAAHQYGRPGILSELYGVTTWDFDFRGYKLQGDWQAALGVIVRVPHLSWMTMRGEAKRDYPASLNYQAPWYRKFSLIEDHFARVNTAMTRGKAMVKIAVVHPVESYWLHWGPEEQTGLIREEMDRRFQELTKWLLCGMLDFDFVCEANLPEQCESGGNPLRVGEMAYDVVILPQCETIRDTTLQRLLSFGKMGGKLLVLGQMPELVDAKESEELWRLKEYADIIPFDRTVLYRELEPWRLIGAADQSGRMTENLFYQLREEGERSWLFVAQGASPRNKDMVTAQEVRLSVAGNYRVECYDSMTGEIEDYPSEFCNRKTVIRKTMYQHDSLLLCLHKRKTAKQQAELQEKEVTAQDRIQGGEWQKARIPETVAIVREEPNVYILDYAEYALDGEDCRPEEEILKADNILRREIGLPSRMDAMAQPWTTQGERAEHTIRLRFRIETEIDAEGLKLAMEDAEAAALYLDGEALPVMIDGWYVDKCIQTFPIPDLKKGEHSLEVILPFGRNHAADWIYLLGDFGVKLLGSRKIITRECGEIGFGDITAQGYPFYSASFSYQIPIAGKGGKMKVHVPQYRGDLLEVALDGKPAGNIIYAPYDCVIPEVDEGEHLLTIKVYGNRYNTFGQIHYCDPLMPLLGPEIYRMEGDAWSREYRLHPAGVLTSPAIFYEK